MLIPDDDVQPSKHVGGNIAYVCVCVYIYIYIYIYIYTSYTQVVGFQWNKNILSSTVL